MPLSHSLQIEWDPRLIKEAVHRVLQFSLSHEYWAQRKLAYEIIGESLRNRRFAEISLDIFRTLMFHVPLDIVLLEHWILSTFTADIHCRRGDSAGAIFVSSITTRVSA